MKLTITSILTLLVPLAACVCQETEVGIGYIHYDDRTNRKGALIANGCNVINHTRRDNYCYGWGVTYQVHCGENHDDAQGVTIRDDNYAECYPVKENEDNCTDGVKVEKCCKLQK